MVPCGPQLRTSEVSPRGPKWCAGVDRDRPTAANTVLMATLTPSGLVEVGDLSADLIEDSSLLMEAFCSFDSELATTTSDPLSSERLPLSGGVSGDAAPSDGTLLLCYHKRRVPALAPPTDVRPLFQPFM